MHLVGDDIHFMEMALEEANVAYNRDEVPVGAVIVLKDRVIARAHNLTQMLCDVTAHAEMQAITSASNFLGSKYLTDCTMYVTLEPCPMCAGALYWSQIASVVYGARDLDRGCIRMQSKLHPKTQWKGGILAAQSELMLKDFFQKKRSLY